jgi:acylphosphatase
MRSVRVVVTGRVQGVGFRWFVHSRAVELGLAGWVRNRVDGAVEAFAAGPEAPLGLLVAALREGPSRARVDDVVVEWGTTAERQEGFRVTG